MLSMQVIKELGKNQAYNILLNRDGQWNLDGSFRTLKVFIALQTRYT